MNTQNDLKQQFSHELMNVYGFWKGLYDPRGGYYGLTDYNLNLHKNAEKGVVLHTRILWFFSRMCRVAEATEALLYARHAYEFLVNFCMDLEHGGMFWMTNCFGQPTDTMKHTYNQAFAVYGLSAYYEASGDERALQTAYALFELIEEKCADMYGYAEAFSRDWTPVDNDKLSEDGFHADKTMNTLLHLIEAYTELYRVGRNEKVREKLIRALIIVAEKVYDPDTHILGVYFDREMKSIAEVHSYGHDIEASWLLDRALEVAGDFNGAEAVRKMNQEIVKKIYATAYFEGVVYNQDIQGKVDKIQIWWIQCESIVGFLNGFEKYHEEEYRTAAEKIWEHVQTCFIDHRAGSEWLYALDKKGRPIENYPIAGPWKCPYHNGRMLLEGMERL